MYALNHPCSYFNNLPRTLDSAEEHLAVEPDEKFFVKHKYSKIKKVGR